MLAGVAPRTPWNSVWLTLPFRAGSVVYAHGQPRGVNAFTLVATELLSDSLFMYACALHWSRFGHEHTHVLYRPGFCR